MDKEKALFAIDEKMKQYADSAKDEALNALIGSKESKELKERNALDYYIRYQTMQTAYEIIRMA